jgi:hypothetical protein
MPIFLYFRLVLLCTEVLWTGDDRFVFVTITDLYKPGTTTLTDN